MIRVAVNGYGTIGKRIADAVSRQDDMVLVGVTKWTPDYEARIATQKGFHIFVDEKNLEIFEEKGIPVRGTIPELLNMCDVVVDCGPAGVGIQNKRIYEQHGVKAIFQGGEDASVGVSFSAVANYDAAVNQDYVRVVSCNTTGLARTLYPLYKNIGVGRVFVTLIRRAVDPKDAKKGPINAIVPEVKVPSHHGPDLKTVMPNIDIDTMAVKVPTTLMHLHTVNVEMNGAPLSDIINTFSDASRVRLVLSSEGLKSTADVIEMTRDLNQSRNDMYEIVVWKDSINIKNNKLFYIQAIHQEADVIPENIDAIRAMFNLSDVKRSMKKTNLTLGIDH